MSPHGDSETPTTLTVITFNLRYASDEPPQSWAQRRPVTHALIEKWAPDVIGTQEGLYRQLKDLEMDLPAYRWIGIGREGGSRGEFMAVFYRTERLEPLAFDHLWLSDTPEVIGSRNWGNRLPRTLTWVKFRDRRNGQGFYFFNTHFSNRSQLARERSAELVLDRINSLKTDLPVLLVGDFNAAAGNSKVYELLVGPEKLIDTWVMAERRSEAVGTRHDYGAPDRDGPRIDWILARGPVHTVATEIVTFALDGQYPSDHFPVVARVRLTGGPSSR